ncbi:thymidylate kinase [Corynebacterium diphtheriae]|nr:thymidylate kinase [Corynebacterium diphtheriae]
MIIAIEGIDGAGKNTLVSALKERLDADVIGFPRYEQSIHAKLAQHALYGSMGDLTDSAYAMATLFALDRYDAKAVLWHYVGTSKVVLLDRYVASNAAYSAARTRNDAMVQWVQELEFEELGLPVPDIHILLHTSPELAAQRAQRREAADASRKLDRYEEDASLQERTFQAYESLAQQKWMSPWLLVHPDESPETVTQRIIQALSA